MDSHGMIIEVAGVTNDQYVRVTPKKYSAGFSQMVTHPVITLVEQGLTSPLWSGSVTRIQIFQT